MYNLSEIIGKQVIGLFEAKCAGTVSNVLTDKSMTRIKYLEVFTDDEDDAEKKYFAPDCIAAVGDAVVLKNLGKLSARLSNPCNYPPSPLSLSAFNPYGKLLGKITEVTLDGFSVKEIIAGDRTFTPESVLSCSGELVIFNDTDEKIKLVPPSNKIPSPKKGRHITVKAHKAAQPAVSESVIAAPDHAIDATAPPQPETTSQPTIQYQSEAVAQTAAQSKPETVAESTVTPKPEVVTETTVQPEIATDATTPQVPSKGNVSVSRYPAESNLTHGGYAFLLGKLVTKTILREDGTAVISNGEYVNENNLAAVAAAGKLVQLALHSK